MRIEFGTPKWLGIAVILFAPSIYAATITGTVNGPDGAPFKGAFVEAQGSRTRITVSVLSDRGGWWASPSNDKVGYFYLANN